MLKEFIAQYGMQILYAAVTAVAGYVAVAVKSLVTKYINDKTKKSVAQTVVRAVEQIYKDLNGEEKLTTALEWAGEMLTDKGITVTHIELRLLLEDAVGEFNNVFSKDGE